MPPHILQPGFYGISSGEKNFVAFRQSASLKIALHTAGFAMDLPEFARDLQGNIYCIGFRGFLALVLCLRPVTSVQQLIERFEPENLLMKDAAKVGGNEVRHIFYRWLTSLPGFDFLC